MRFLRCFVAINISHIIAKHVPFRLMRLPGVGAALFAWLQSADFYYQLHKYAVELLPPGENQLWYDVGCGPGLVARLAAGHGYRATGFDMSAAMIKQAHRISALQYSSARFTPQGIEALAASTAPSAEVVSAASLIAVLDDKVAGLNQLWQLVAPGGALLIIEPTNKMAVTAALSLLRAGLPGRHSSGLLFWARARQGRSAAVVVRAWQPAGEIERHYTPLLDGLVGAWIFRKRTNPDD